MTEADALSVVAANAQLLLQRFAAHLPTLLLAALGFALFVGLGRLLRRVVRAAARRADPSLGRMLGGIANALSVAAGILVALWIAVPTVRFSEIFASLGVTGLVLGFALRDILENFVAGILILWRRPFRAGDQIRSGSYEGTVEEVNFRSTVLQGYDGIRIFIPNGRVLTEPVENLTAFRRRRSTVVLGIDQAASVARARRVILDALAPLEDVLRDPPPLVLFETIGDFTNDLHVIYWTQPPTRLSERQTRSDVTERLYEALTAAGIGFPYPIRTVRLDPRGAPPAPARSQA